MKSTPPNSRQMVGFLPGCVPFPGTRQPSEARVTEAQAEVGKHPFFPLFFPVILLAEVCYVFAPFGLALHPLLGPSQEALKFCFAVDHQGFT